MRKTKIVCTIGPASERLETINEMIKAGMNVARLNFSHGSHEEHAKRITTIRCAAQEMGQNIAILLDTKGPEIRLGDFQEQPVLLEAGQSFFLTTEPIIGDQHGVSVTYEDLSKDVKRGDRILVDDGLIELVVEAVEEKKIVCRVMNGGKVSNRKGVNLPDIHVNLPAVTEKDIADIKFGIEQQVDFIAASFVRKAGDVLAIRKILEDDGAKIDIIAKIESREAVDNLDEIIQASDGIMVARGDLGVEIPAEEVPIIQKKIITICNQVGKPVITATQMLDSMIQNPRPTRAEASDVANAIFDGTDAIMLSGESANGKYPVEAVRTMDRIARRSEQALSDGAKTYTNCFSVTDALGQAVCTVANQLDAAAIITATTSGYTAKMISRYRPQSAIVAVTPDRGVMRRLSLVWGVVALPSPKLTNTDQMIATAVDTAVEQKVVKGGDLVVITAGVPVGLQGTTNLMKIHTVGTIVSSGTGIVAQAVSGPVRVCNDAEEAARLEPGEILVTNGTDAGFVPFLKNAAAIVAEEGGLTSHAAILGLELKVPTIVGAKGASGIFKNGEIITVDGQSGVIYRGNAKVF
ncbi:pyruvate kinase [Desulforamulus reducens MI-1]|uniref:Pyruvate kinase n=1 Tax=Desulforamulus reducens (strain ATCC BAA-1160 / DSM 100696 / MI-1) TaxID=349161 RepID=A4J1H6_DESRM|nr:pyruvate kinase [Desulforamulus reducens]ABO48929.1 pyruvate kinase [Desulforamulus reducens MI-1]